MKAAAALLAFCGSFYCGVARAQEGFKIPSPDVPDLDPSLTIVQGEVADLTWTANATYQPSVDGKPVMGSDSRVSLWLTSWAWDGKRFGKLLTASVTSTGDSSSWTYLVDLTDDEINRWKGQFTYRLMKPVSSSNAAFDDSQTTIVSRAFIIRKKSDIAASMASVSASYSRAVAASQSSGTAVSTTPATQSTPAANAAHTTASDGANKSSSETVSSNSALSTGGGSSSNASTKGTSGSRLSTGAKAGIAVSIISIVALGAIAAFLLIRRRRKVSLSSGHNGQHGPGKLTPELQQTTVYRHEAPGSGPMAYEMPAQQGHEYQAELAGTQLR